MTVDWLVVTLAFPSIITRPVEEIALSIPLTTAVPLIVMIVVPAFVIVPSVSFALTVPPLIVQVPLEPGAK